MRTNSSLGVLEISRKAIENNLQSIKQTGRQTDSKGDSQITRQVDRLSESNIQTDSIMTIDRKTMGRNDDW